MVPATSQHACPAPDVNAGQTPESSAPAAPGVLPQSMNSQQFGRAALELQLVVAFRDGRGLFKILQP
jgi:hypothetical protein